MAGYTFVQLRERAAFLAMQAGFAETPFAPDWVRLVNLAMTDFSFDTEFSVAQVTFLSSQNQAVYTLPAPDWKYVTDCLYGTGLPLVKSSEQAERDMNATWFVQPAGQPARFLMVGPNKIQLYPTPNDSATTIYVRGLQAAADLVAASDVPPFQSTFHEALALRAVVIWLEGWYQGPKLDLYRELYAGYVKQFRALQLKDEYGTIQRSVDMRYPYRVITGANR